MRKKDNKRYDSKRRLLRKCEYEKADGNYLYRWTDSQGKRHSISATTLEELRKKEEEIRVNVLHIYVDYQHATIISI